MLAPSSRSLYVEALVPPIGFELKYAVATTYSADPDVLLGVPIHLALAERSIPKDLDGSALAILGALHRLANRMTVFAQSGLVKVPSKPHALYALLEPVLIDVRGKNGAFHAKLWVLRFERPDGEARMRLIVPTRNLTSDRCWDASLVLDGVVSGGPKAVNKPLADLLLALPGLAVSPVTDQVTKHIADVAEHVRRTEWETPTDWELVAFHVLGFSRSRSLPIEPSDELLVVSPFLSADTLSALTQTTKRPRALVSRPEELARVGSKAIGRFEDVRVLKETAATDPEGGDDLESRLRGLHAKLYVATTRTTTNLWIGSSNATHAGLMDARNVEILVQLRTTKRGVRPIDDFLGNEGMGLLLEPFDALMVPTPPDEHSAHLKLGQELLGSAQLTLRVEGHDDAWSILLETPERVLVPPSVAIRVWPVSVAQPMAVDGSPLREGRSVRTSEATLSALTGLIAFELSEGDDVIQFVRNLPVTNMPAAREGELLHSVIGNRDRFLALMLALFGDNAALAGGDKDPVSHRSSSGRAGPGADGSGLLEHLVRACSRDRARLSEATSLVKSLQLSKGGASLVPEGFPELLALLEEVTL